MNHLNSRMFMTEHAEGHEEPWLVSYADMMTLLFGFFVILYSFSTLDERKLSTIGEEVSEAFGGRKDGDPARKMILDQERLLRAMALLSSMSGSGSTPEMMVDRIEKAFAQHQKSTTVADQTAKQLQEAELIKGLTVDAGNGGDQVIKIVLPTAFLFEPNTARLSLQSLATLKSVAERIRRSAGVLAIDVVGHSDARPARKDSGIDNWGLAAARATAVAKQISGNGIAMKDLNIVSKGDQEPLFPSMDQRGRWIEDNLRRNRRVEIVVHKKK